MKEFSAFLANNYIWFIIADIFVLFVLFWYLKDPDNKIRRKKKLETIKFVDKNDIVEELDVPIKDKEKSLNDLINSNKNTNSKKEDTEVLN